LEKSEPLKMADGFYDKNVVSISFFMRVAARGRFFMSVSFAITAIELMLCIRVMAQEVFFS
jgi:hypothetical protein